MGNSQSKSISPSEALALGDVEHALDLAEQVLCAQPDDPEALLIKGTACKVLGRGMEALQALSTYLARAPEDMKAAFELADLLYYDEGDVEGALDLVEGCLYRTMIPSLYIDFLRLKSRLSLERSEPMEALCCMEQIRRLAPGELDPVQYGITLVETFSFEDAVRVLKQALQRADEGKAEIHFNLAVALERCGKPRSAQIHFRKAAALDAEGFAIPMHLEPEDFRSLVSRTLRRLPPTVLAYLQAMPITIAQCPSEDEMLSLTPPGSALLLGIFKEHDEGSDGAWSGLPAEVQLFQRNIELLSTSEAEMEQQVETAVMHEFCLWTGMMSLEPVEHPD